MATRSVDVVAVNREVTAYNKEGELMHLGEIMSETYGADEVQRFTFYPTKENPWATGSKHETGYALGTGSSNMSFVNPSDAQKQMLDRGLVMEDVIAWKGGLHMNTKWVDLDNKLPDPFEYDREFWEVYGRDESWMHPSVSLTTNLSIGRMAARYVAGIYRLVCTNGLEAKILNLPEVDIRHTDWEVSALDDKLSGLGLGAEGIRLQALEHGLTNYNHMHAAVNLYKRYITEGMRDIGLSNEMLMLEKNVFGISRNTLASWAMQGFVDQLDLLVEHFEPTDVVTSGHLINAYTNMLNVHRIRSGHDRGIWQAWERMDAVLNTTVSLANISALFSAN